MPPKKAKQGSGGGASGDSANIPSPPPTTNISRGATPTEGSNESPPCSNQGNTTVSLGGSTPPPGSYSAAVLGSVMQPPGATASAFSPNSLFTAPASTVVQSTNVMNAPSLGNSTSSVMNPAAMVGPTNIPANATPLVICGVVFHKLPVKTISRSSNALGKDRRLAMSQADLVKLRGQATATLNNRVRIIQPLPDSFDDPQKLIDIQNPIVALGNLCQPPENIRHDGP